MLIKWRYTVELVHIAHTHHRHKNWSSATHDCDDAKFTESMNGRSECYFILKQFSVDRCCRCSPYHPTQHNSTQLGGAIASLFHNLLIARRARINYESQRLLLMVAMVVVPQPVVERRKPNFLILFSNLCVIYSLAPNMCNVHPLSLCNRMRLKISQWKSGAGIERMQDGFNMSAWEAGAHEMNCAGDVVTVLGREIPFTMHFNNVPG